MRNIAPNITRQRLLLEGFFAIEVNEFIINNFLQSIAKELYLRTYGEPIIFSPSGTGKKENQGYDAFIPLIDSGISAYFWTQHKFFSIIIYTCKRFNEEAAILFTQEFFEVKEEIAYLSF